MKKKIQCGVETVKYRVVDACGDNANGLNCQGQLNNVSFTRTAKRHKNWTNMLQSP